MLFTQKPREHPMHQLDNEFLAQDTSDPLSLGTRQLSRVLGGYGQPGCGESLVDVLVDGVECGAELGWGLGLVGGEEGVRMRPCTLV
jgi:hypothetical protein